MSTFKPQQRHLAIRGRSLHFVSYEGQPSNPRRGEESRPPMWYLMVGGRRFPAFPYDPAQPLPQVDEELLRWAEANALGAADEAPQEPAVAERVRAPRRGNWWGPS